MSNQPRYPRRAEPTRTNDILCWEQAAPDAPVVLRCRDGKVGPSLWDSIDKVLVHEAAVEVFDHLPAEATECAPELPQPCVPAAKKLVYEAMTYAPPVEASTPAGQGSEQHEARCYECDRLYGDEHGFPDLVIPNDLWRKISPTGDEGGLLCPSCICKRLHAAGVKRCPASFMSGPIDSVSSHLMYAYRWTENLREASERDKPILSHSAEQIRYGAEEIDGRRTAIVVDEAPAPQPAPQGEVEAAMKHPGVADLMELQRTIDIHAALDHERTVAELRAEVERLKDPDKYSVPHGVQERIKELRTELAERKATARRAAQILIEEVGAPGPENVDETAVRTVNKIKAMRERADELTARSEAAEAERDDLRAKLEQAEAAAAAMREALAHAREFIGKFRVPQSIADAAMQVMITGKSAIDRADYALDGTAGRYLLAELNRLRNQLRIEYSRNDALARIRDVAARIAQVFGDDVGFVMPVDGELGCVQWVLNRYKEIKDRAVKYEADGAEYRELALTWERKCAAILMAETAWPLRDTVAKLIEATEHLLDDHDCDAHGHEQYRIAVNVAKNWAAALDDAKEAT